MMMSRSNPTHANAALLFLLIFLTASSLRLCCCMRNTSIFCPETEKHSLLTLKQSLEDPSHLLSSWGGTEVNCCKWNGVVCDNSTGHVTELHLDGGFSGKINPSLINLKFLRYLNLTVSEIGEISIPSFIGSFTYLEYLNLDGNAFHGKIPPTIRNLSNLHTLLLHSDALSADSLEWLWGLTKLKYLNMKDVDLQKVHNLPKVINSLPSLIELSLSHCNLDPFMAPPDDVNVTSLTLLDLSGNHIESVPFLRWIFQLNELLYLDLSQNHFEGAVPSFINVTNLHHIDLSSNSFNSSIPDSLYFCRDLEFVDLSYNFLQGTLSNAIANLTSLATLHLTYNHKLSGKIPKEIAYLCKLKELHLDDNELRGDIADSFGNMSGCFLGSLEFLSLNGNQLSGELKFGEFKRLTFLNLGNNLLSGEIPVALGRMSSLKYVVLQANKFTGNVPESLGELLNLLYLEISDNKLEGVVSEAHFKNLHNLKYFSASGNNHLSLKISPDWIPPFQLSYLDLESLDMGVGSPIPSWLTQKDSITFLDLSNTGISGSVPEWLLGINTLNLSHNKLHGQIPSVNGLGSDDQYDQYDQYLYLSCNQFSGSLPLIRGSLGTLDLSNNSISGGISHFLCDTTFLTYDLVYLNLGNNQLSGELPSDDCWKKCPELVYSNIGDNMSGSIPNSIGFLTSLASLNLYGNKFSGPVPFSLSNCTQLQKIDLACNGLDGNMPSWIGKSLAHLMFLILRSNNFDGPIPLEICLLNHLQILDLSDNKFSGIIPACVHNFTAMATTRYLQFLDYQTEVEESASVATKGTILKYDTILELVTNIDLSKNNLSGAIPKGLTSLVELRSLNLSQNHFTGSIPDKIGNMKQLESLDFSNNSLSGQIPSSFADVSSLSYLNVSYNNLTGRIPHGTQLQSMDASAFIGNNLCGPPLTSNCSSDNGGNQVPRVKQDDEGKIEWLYAFMSLGNAVGFSAVCTTLVLKKSWRVAYFKLLEGMWYKLYVYVCVKWTRLVKPSISTS